MTANAAAGEPDAQYADPALVALYDRLNPEASDTAFYRARIGMPPKRVLDLGCGTGMLALQLASDGHAVTGLEPAAAMLAVAKGRDRADLVSWVHGHARDLPASDRFDVAVMTGHAFQCLLTDEAVADALGAVRTRVVPGGRFLFDTRAPAARAWERWTPEASIRTVTDDDGRAVRVWHEVSTVAGDLVSFRTTYRFADRDLVSASRLRFPSRPAVERALRDTGFDDLTWFGDWDGSPWTDASPEIIVAAA